MPPWHLPTFGADVKNLMCNRGETSMQDGIANSKFAPPINISQTLLRERVLAEIIAHKGKPKKCLLIEAQAGQGKTTLAAQYLRQTGIPFAWYQIGREDIDPIFFLTTLIESIKNGLPAFCSPLLEDMAAKGELVSQELARYGETLVNDLALHLHKPFVLILDDFHLLNDSSRTSEFIAHLASDSPPRLRFMILSRRSIWPNAKPPLPASDILLVNNDKLALDKTEIAALFNSTLGKPLAATDVQILQQMTEGWPMGLILAGTKLSDNPAIQTAKQVVNLLALYPKGFRQYFQEEVLAFLPQRLQIPMSRLALLRKIPLNLAEDLADMAPGEVEKELRSLVSRNLFLRFLGDKEKTFVFHHLFHDILRAQAIDSLDREDRYAILHAAAEWYRKRNKADEAIHYLLEAEDHAAVEMYLKEAGTELLAKNQIVTMQAILERIPVEIVECSPWLLYFHGAVLMETEPHAALPYLEQAQMGFAAEGDEKGELLALVMIIYFHIGVDSDFNRGERHVERAGSLFLRLEQNIDPNVRFFTSYVLGASCCFLDSRMDRAHLYCETIADQARMQGITENQAAMYLFVLIQKNIFSGNLQGVKNELDSATAVFASENVSGFNRTLLMIHPLTLLHIEGDFVNYRHYKQTLDRSIEFDFALKNAVGSWINIYEIDVAIAEGRFVDAEAILTKVFSSPQLAPSPHSESCFLCYKSYVLAATGDKKGSTATAEKALAIREKVGARMYRLYNWRVIGAAYAFAGMEEEGEIYLAQVIEAASLVGDVTASSGACLHRAFLRLSLGKKEAALADVRELMCWLAENRNVRHFYGTAPVMWRTLLATAIAEDIHASHAQVLAREILDETFLPGLDDPIPLLGISTLGRLELRTSEVATVRDYELTPNQKKILGMLLTAPSLALTQEEVQVALWPDSPPRKARSRFDNLMTRLRKTLAGAVAPHNLHYYLVVEKGMVRLRNCRVDHIDFANHVRKGLVHLRHKQPWQATNAFYPAIRLWHGPFLAGLPLDSNSLVLQRELTRQYLDCVEQWSQIWPRFGRLDETVEVTDRAFKCEPTHEPLARRLYALHTQTNNPVQAAHCLKNYRQALHAEGFSPAEVEEIMENFWNNNNVE